MDKFHGRQFIRAFSLVLGLVISTGYPLSSSFAQVTTAITPSGLNTQVSAPTTLPNGQVNYNITGGTRPGNGPNLFQSFGDFSVGANNIANFLNNTGLPTTNILSRVTGGNPSNIFGTLQTTGFGNANLFLINPAGVVFGPTASLNVGGSVNVSTANYVKLADGTRFNAVAGPQDALLSSAPIAAFGFLGTTLPGGQAGMITVQPNATLTVLTGQTLSLVGRDNASGTGQTAGVAITGGTLNAEAGRINLVSVGRPQNPKTGGEINASDLSPSATSGFKNLGTVIVADGATLSTSTLGGSGGLQGGTISIRGGELIVSNSSLTADGLGRNFASPGGRIEVYAGTVMLDQATISASSDRGSAGQIIFSDLTTLTSTKSTLAANVRTFQANDATTRGGSLTIGSTETKSVTLTDTTLSASTNASSPGTGFYAGNAGDITVTGRDLSINGGNMSSIAGSQSFRAGGSITLNGDRIALTDSSMSSYNMIGGFSNGGGTINLQGIGSTETTPTAARSVIIDNSVISAGGGLGLGIWLGGNLSIHAKAVMLNNANLIASGYYQGGNINLADVGTLQIMQSTLNAANGGPPFGEGGGGTIMLGSTATKSITLQNSTLNASSFKGDGGTINITASKQFQSVGSTLDASSYLANGGAVSIRAGNISVTDGSTVTAQGAGPGQEGTIRLEFDKKLTVQDSVLTPAPTIVSGKEGE